MEFDFYQLKRPPFSAAPDPECLFVSASHKTALQDVMRGIEERCGLIVLVGDAGLGKTTLLYAFLAVRDDQRLKTIYLFYPRLSIHEVLRIVYQEFGLEEPPADPAEMIDTLRRVLIEEYKKSRNCVLIIDEAQNIPAQTLEYLLQLANLQIVGKNLIQVVLSGQPALKEKVKHLELKKYPNIRPMFTALVPLNKKESEAYIHYRLSQVVSNDDPLFTSGALRCLVRSAQGNPRVLNSLCAKALAIGALLRQQPVSARMVRKALRHTREKRPRRLWQWACAATVGVLLWLGLLQDSAPTRWLGATFAGLDLSFLTTLRLSGLSGLPSADSRRVVGQRDADAWLSQSAVEVARVAEVTTVPLSPSPDRCETLLPAMIMPLAPHYHLDIPTALMTPVQKTPTLALATQPFSPVMPETSMVPRRTLSQGNCLLAILQGHDCAAGVVLPPAAVVPAGQAKEAVGTTPGSPAAEDCLIKALQGSPCANPSSPAASPR
jgi:general secretion pathway protein A